MARANDSSISFCRVLLNALYPPKCSLCDSFSATNPCVACQGEMLRLDPVVTYMNEGPVAFRASPYRYKGRAGQAVRLLKYERRTSLIPYLSESIARVVEDEGLEYDFAAPVPIHWMRLAWRGFNQAEVLSQTLPGREHCLRRVRSTKPQAGLSTEERLSNLEGAFEVVRDVQGKRVLLIDDVVTSGRTVTECAKTLRAAGALEVGVVSFCGDSYT